MKIYFFYRPQTESDLAVENYLRLLSERQKAKIELVNVDTPNGDHLSRLYDIMSYPTALVTTDDGQQIKFWHGQLPIVDDLTVYLSD